MEILNEFISVLIITMIFLALGFGVFCYQHSKQHRKK